MELVRLHEVSKDFFGVKALKKVSLGVNAGECLALVGENGAGKSTLMKILSGVYPTGDYSGEISIRGQKVSFASPKEAEAAGVAIIHQELSAFAHLTVAENMFVGHWPTKFGLVSWPAIRKFASEWIEKVGADCSPDDLMSSLTVGTQQMIEIAKALARKSQILILDEPTSALTPAEVSRLFSLLKDLRSQGRALVYISHKLEEVYELSDRITVLRDGETVHTALTKELPERELIQHMVGRSIDRVFPTPPARDLKEVTLSFKDYEGYNELGRKRFGPINIDLRRGEIIGFGGLLGARRTDLVKAVFGDEHITSRGSIELLGRPYLPTNPREGLRQRLSYVSEDRKRESILGQRSLDENVSLSRLSSGNLLAWLNLERELEISRESLLKLRTKSTGPDQEIRRLSGGNQQKVIIARSLQVLPEVIILDEPTRGVDVGAKYEIYEILFQLVAAGKSLLVVSSDLPELMALSDRIVVLRKGQQMGVLDRSQFSQVAIMTLAIGRQAESGS